MALDLGKSQHSGTPIIAALICSSETSRGHGTPPLPIFLSRPEGEPKQKHRPEGVEPDQRVCAQPSVPMYKYLSVPYSDRPPQSPEHTTSVPSPGCSRPGDKGTTDISLNHNNSWHSLSFSCVPRTTHSALYMSQERINNLPELAQLVNGLAGT